MKTLFTLILLPFAALAQLKFEGLPPGTFADSDKDGVVINRKLPDDTYANFRTPLSVFGPLYYSAEMHALSGMAKVVNTTLAGLTGISGVTFNARSGTVFCIKNVGGAAGEIYEVSRTGTVLRTIVNSNFEDTEAIAWVRYDPAVAADVFVIAEENNQQRLSLCRLTPVATTMDRTAIGNVSATTAYAGGTIDNLGLESVCYDPRRRAVYYTAEKRTQAGIPTAPGSSDAKVYTRGVTTTGTMSFGAESVLCDVAPLFSGTLTDISDMAVDYNQDQLLILSDESKKVLRVSRAGALIETLPLTGLTQPEGLAFHPMGTQIFVVGEPNEFTTYELGWHQ